MISFTGAYLGVVAILGPLVALIAFQGDTESLVAKVIGEPVEAVGQSATMFSVDDVFDMKHPDNQNKPIRVIVSNYGDINAHYRVIYDATTQLATFKEIELNGVDGTVLAQNSDIPTDTTANRILNALTPLHYATYGDIWLKWVYAVLGVFLVILTATGLMLFVERRLHGPEGSRSEKFYQRLNKVNIGVCMGFPIATVVLFYHDKLYTGLETERLYWTGITYFSAVGAVVISTFFQKDGYKAVRWLMTILGGLTFFIPLLNYITTDATLWVSDSIGSSYSNGVDISMLVVGIIILIATTQIPTARNQRKRRVKKTTVEPLAQAAE